MNHFALKLALSCILIDIVIGPNIHNLILVRIKNPDDIAWNSVVVIVVRID